MSDLFPLSFPTFETLETLETLEQERTHLKQRLAATFRLFGRFGFTQVGSNLAGWFSFQPLYDKIVTDCPELLD